MPRYTVGLLLIFLTAGCASSLNHQSNALPGRNFIPDCGSNELVVRASNHGSTPADLYVGKDLVGTVSPGSTLLVPVTTSSWLRGAVRASPTHRDLTGSEPVGRPPSSSGMVLSAQCP